MATGRNTPSPGPKPGSGRMGLNIEENLLATGQYRYAKVLKRVPGEYLAELFKGLVVTLQELEKLLKSLEASRAAASGPPQNDRDETPEPRPPAATRRPTVLPFRTDLVRVEVRCSFVSIFHVDVPQQMFKAEVLIQAKWQEPKLASDGRGRDFGEIYDDVFLWNPNLKILNLLETASEEVSCGVLYNLPGYEHPLVVRNWRICGSFVNKFDLRYFPFDVQDVVVELAARRGVAEVELIEDKLALSTVNVNMFLPSVEWQVYSHVESLQFKTNLISATKACPVLNIRCQMRRRLRYYFWNVYFLMFVISALGTTTMAIDVGSSDRLLVSAVLFLTAVTAKLLVGNRLPRLSFVSFVDIYNMFAIVLMGLQTLENAFIHYASNYLQTNKLDKYSIFLTVVWAGNLVLFQVLYFVHVFLTTKEIRKLREIKDRIYKDHLERITTRHLSRKTANI